LETFVAVVATAVALLFATLAARMARRQRGNKPGVSSQEGLGEVLLDTAALGGKKGTCAASPAQSAGASPRALLAIRMGLSIVVVVPALGVLVFGGADHSWKSGAQYALGMVMGYWFNEGRKGR